MFNSILLQGAFGGGGASSLLLIGGMFVVMYFFMIRPQQKKQKDQQAYVDALKTGDKVVTIGGLHGTVTSVREKTVVLEVDSSKGVRMVFLKTAISKDSSAQIGE
ncbi:MULTISPECIES: preprotein translocase subunit YajC [Arcicella]|uniref:Sec translocon accessory complex subunit YajC n=3 Tax=Arcicella TaxID=217140 RepID=A0A841EIM0_9BACT|nr:MULTISPECIES: preprotein translocase subunit YajC [Arcicella]MBB6002074.1 preprotein translocase subunit YajC [Arcicella rosea]MEA5401866.1 preprotein translocase subunit YajC [Arcicella sp. DC2W]MEA5425678.1 preprotein translocase subunit YajC [Arcicella sp. DC25W]